MSDSAFKAFGLGALVGGVAYAVYKAIENGQELVELNNKVTLLQCATEDLTGGLEAETKARVALGDATHAALTKFNQDLEDCHNRAAALETNVSSLSAANAKLQTAVAKLSSSLTQVANQSQPAPAVQQPQPQPQQQQTTVIPQPTSNSAVVNPVAAAVQAQQSAAPQQPQQQPNVAVTNTATATAAAPATTD